MGEFTIKFVFFPSSHSDIIFIVGMMVVSMHTILGNDDVRRIFQSFNTNFEKGQSCIGQTWHVSVCTCVVDNMYA
jgi:hypothetical protein